MYDEVGFNDMLYALAQKRDASISPKDEGSMVALSAYLDRITDVDAFCFFNKDLILFTNPSDISFIEDDVRVIDSLRSRAMRCTLDAILLHNDPHLNDSYIAFVSNTANEPFIINGEDRRTYLLGRDDVIVVCPRVGSYQTAARKYGLLNFLKTEQRQMRMREDFLDACEADKVAPEQAAYRRFKSLCEEVKTDFNVDAYVWLCRSDALSFRFSVELKDDAHATEQVISQRVMHELERFPFDVLASSSIVSRASWQILYFEFLANW